MDEKLKELFQKLREKRLSDQEKELLDTWYAAEAQKKRFDELDLSALAEDLTHLKGLSTNIIRERRIYRRRLYWTSSAAAAILIGFFTMFFFFRNDTSTSENEIVIGGNKAQLKRSNGEVLDLARIARNQDVVLGGVIIQKSDDGTITYKSNANNSENLTYDEIITPRGGEFKIILADGTKVWLNPKSSLKFFSNLKGINREVWLKGEAYFEVEHNKEKPFLVYADQQSIRVLGTKFNVKTASKQSQTTLIEGSVSLRDGKIKLRPGEQLTTNQRVDQSVVSVDVESYLAWKEGYFLFNNDPLIDVMRRISDWYDVDFEFEDHVENEKIWATVSKYRDINEVLRMIELTGAAQFSIKGRRITIRR